MQYDIHRQYIQKVFPWPSRKIIYVDLENQPDGKERFFIDLDSGPHELLQLLYDAALVALANHLLVTIVSTNEAERKIVSICIHSS